MILLRKQNNFKVYLFTSGLYWIVKDGEVVKKVNSIKEYMEFIK